MEVSVFMIMYRGSTEAVASLEKVFITREFKGSGVTFSRDALVLTMPCSFT